MIRRLFTATIKGFPDRRPEIAEYSLGISGRSNFGNDLETMQLYWFIL